MVGSKRVEFGALRVIKLPHASHKMKKILIFFVKIISSKEYNGFHL